jgi:ribonuclease HI
LNYERYYDAESAALARALETAARRRTTPEKVTIFTDAQAAIKRMASEEPGPSQMYVIQARKHIATLRRARPGITIEIRWCPAHKGVPRNDMADEWAKLAAEKPGARGVEYEKHLDRYDRRLVPLPRSLAHLKQEISEKKWLEAKMWADSRVTGKKYQYCRQGKVCYKPDAAPAKTSKRLAARFYQLKMGHWLTGQYLKWTKNRPSAKCWWCPYQSQTREHLFKHCPQ